MTTPTSKSLDTQSLPDSTGIYFFRGRDERPVYIGKSINIRKRVLSHIYDAKTDLKERKIINATQSITYEETPSELSALLLESMRIKQLNPLFNRRLRKTQKVYTWHLKTKQDTQTGEALLIPYLGEAPWPPNPIKDNFGSDTFGTDTFGWYRSKTHAEKHLCTLADKHQLCKKILGLEKTKRGCFGYQLKKCPGTCLKLEPIAEYNKRLEKAIEHHIIKAWPYSGTIGVGDGSLWVITAENLEKAIARIDPLTIKAKAINQSINSAHSLFLS